MAYPSEVISASQAAAIRVTFQPRSRGLPLTFHNGAQAQGQCSGYVKIAGDTWNAVNGGTSFCRKGARGPLPTP